MKSKIIWLSLLIFSFIIIGNSYTKDEKKIFIKDLEEYIVWSDKWIGVLVKDVKEEDAKEFKLPEIIGVIVTEVKPGSPAEKAGLRENDVILEFDKEKVRSAMALRRMIEETPEGKKVNLTIWRDGRVKNLTIEVISKRKWEFKMPPMPPFKDWFHDFWSEQNCLYLGLELQDIGTGLRNYFGVKENIGVLIAEVEKNSLAEKSGFKAGDVIIRINENEIDRAFQVREFLCEHKDLSEVIFTVIRDKKEIKISVKRIKQKLEKI